jgi:tetratricopeptide (TPR) repeat protein
MIESSRIINLVMLPALLLAAPLPVSAATPREQLNQLVEELQKNPADAALRERLIKHARTVKPAPALPEEAERRLARGAAAVKAAKSPLDYQEAAKEFEQATLAAPWLASAYLSLGTARNQAEDYGGAASAFKFYLLAAPNARNAKEIKALMYEMEFKQEKAGKEKAAKQASEDQMRRAEQVLQPLKGAWFGSNCAVGDDHFGGCTEADKAGTNWYRFDGPDGAFRYSFTFPGDGTVKLDAYESWAECKNGIVWGNAVAASSLQEVRWEFRPTAGGPARQVYSRIANDGSFLEISCDRPLSGASATVKFHYVQWFRPK